MKSFLHVYPCIPLTPIPDWCTDVDLYLCWLIGLIGYLFAGNLFKGTVITVVACAQQLSAAAKGAYRREEIDSRIAVATCLPEEPCLSNESCCLSVSLVWVLITHLASTDLLSKPNCFTSPVLLFLQPIDCHQTSYADFPLTLAMYCYVRTVRCLPVALWPVVLKGGPNSRRLMGKLFWMGNKISEF